MKQVLKVNTRKFSLQPAGSQCRCAYLRVCCCLVCLGVMRACIRCIRSHEEIGLWQWPKQRRRGSPFCLPPVLLPRPCHSIICETPPPQTIAPITLSPAQRKNQRIRILLYFPGSRAESNSSHTPMLVADCWRTVNFPHSCHSMYLQRMARDSLRDNNLCLSQSVSSSGFAVNQGEGRRKGSTRDK